MGTTDGLLLLSLQAEAVLLALYGTLLHAAFCFDVVTAVEEVRTGVGLCLFFLFTLLNRPCVDLVLGGQFVLLGCLLFCLILWLTRLFAQTASKILIGLLWLVGVFCPFCCGCWRVWIGIGAISRRGLALRECLRVCTIQLYFRVGLLMDLLGSLYLFGPWVGD